MKWELVNAAIGEPEIIVRDDEDLTWGFSLLAELAREDKSMYQLADGVWCVDKPLGIRES